MPSRQKEISQISHINLSRQHPPITLDDLATMLDMELSLFNDRKEFRNRLQRALNDAYRQGFDQRADALQPSQSR